jgi:two-component system OmpR family response regulator
MTRLTHDALAQQRILIVEDDPTLSRLLNDLLTDEGGDVQVAHSAAAAQALINTFVPDLVLLDVALPDGNGFDLCARWRRDQPQMPIVFVTGRRRPEDECRGKSVGASDYVTKPFALADLLERLRGVMERARLWPAV